jgi:hypothetical protein
MAVPFAVLAPGCQSGNFWIHPLISYADECIIVSTFTAPMNGVYMLPFCSADQIVSQSVNRMFLDRFFLPFL